MTEGRRIHWKVSWFGSRIGQVTRRFKIIGSQRSARIEDQTWNWNANFRKMHGRHESCLQTQWSEAWIQSLSFEWERKGKHNNETITC